MQESANLLAASYVSPSSHPLPKADGRAKEDDSGAAEAKAPRNHASLPGCDEDESASLLATDLIRSANEQQRVASCQRSDEASVSCGLMATRGEEEKGDRSSESQRARSEATASQQSASAEEEKASERREARTLQLTASGRQRMEESGDLPLEPAAAVQPGKGDEAGKGLGPLSPLPLEGCCVRHPQESLRVESGHDRHTTAVDDSARCSKTQAIRAPLSVICPSPSNGKIPMGEGTPLMRSMASGSSEAGPLRIASDTLSARGVSGKLLEDGSKEPIPELARRKLLSLARCARQLLSREGRREFAAEPGNMRSLKEFGYGLLAGAVSGVMAGLTGMGGPPVMLLFSVLRIEKDVVRATNAWIASLQVWLPWNVR